jgi:HEAT repeat protein
VDALVLCGGVVVLVCALGAWVTLSFVVVLGRLRFDRRRYSEPTNISRRKAKALVRRASRPSATEWGGWRRLTALRRLERARHPAVPRLIRPLLADPDRRIATAAIRTLGDVADGWAIGLLVDALRLGHGPRSRVAAELERLAPAPGPRLVPLLRDRSPAVRFWAAMLLRPYSDVGESTLIELTWDANPNVRAAAVETLGSRSGTAVGAALLARLDDDAWFVRAHAARAAARVLGSEAAPTIVRLLADGRWWVRTAAKDALRSIGSDAAPSLVSNLVHKDEFARNGAAEVLQDIGFVDSLALGGANSSLLARIYAAGGDDFRDAANARIGAAAARAAADRARTAAA